MTLTADAFQLTDHVVLVSGAGRGIGRGVALACAAFGADVVVAARSVDALQLVAAEIHALGRRALVVPTDMADPAARTALVQAAVAEFGRLDTVVNNVGGTMPARFPDLTSAAFEDALSFNVTTAFDLTQAALSHLQTSDNGSVVNISSMAGLFGIRGLTAYGTAKAALNGLTRNLAQDLAPRVRVNAVAPGLIETDSTKALLAIPRYADGVVAATPMRRWGVVEDIAAAVVFLASPAATFITGQILPVDGGAAGPVLDWEHPDL